ncbi:MAG TPA: CoA ester lyase [Hyphomicrobiaceae bacterium]|nr:CoA ester lyase [Hyphomicrobiaceae bacterium]
MRSLLFVPADDERKLGKGLATGADALILDLEDSVSPGRKAAARTLAAQYVAEALPKAGRPRLYVRINALETGLWLDDIAAVIGARPDGIILPKPRSGDDVHRLSLALRHEEEHASVPVGSIRIIAIATETPASLFHLHTYSDSSSRLEALTWGAEDLSAVIGSARTREADGCGWTSPYRLARDLTLFAAAAGGVEAIDTVFVNFRDGEGLKRECEAAARDGFTGKMAIHPGQVETINAAFTPSAAAVAEAQEIVQLFADTPGAGALSLRGQMVDRPHLTRAERTLARARAAGLI